LGTGDVESDVNGAELQRFAADLRGCFTAEEYRRLAKLLTTNQSEGAA